MGQVEKQRRWCPIERSELQKQNRIAQAFKRRWVPEALVRPEHTSSQQQQHETQREVRTRTRRGGGKQSSQNEWDKPRAEASAQLAFNEHRRSNSSNTKRGGAGRNTTNRRRSAKRGKKPTGELEVKHPGELKQQWKRKPSAQIEGKENERSESGKASEELDLKRRDY